APDLGDRELEALGLLDAYAVLGAGHRIEDRGPAHLEQASDAAARRACLDVDLEVDVGEDGLVQHVAGGGEDLEHGGAGLGVLAVQDGAQRAALRRRGVLVDDVEALAAAEMDRSRPAEYGGSAQAVEARRTVIALFDLEHGEPAAMPLRRQRVELARTAV